MGIYAANLGGQNQDARCVHMQARAASILTKLELHIGSQTYTLNRPTSGTIESTINSARFKVSFSSLNSGLSTVWDIYIKLPSNMAGSAKTVYFSFSKGTVTGVNSANITGFIPYKSSIKTGVNPASNLQSLLNSMAQTGYTFTVRNWDNSLVNVTSATKAATGMKIFKKNSNNMIVEIYYVVLFGDVTGNGVVGDGIINSDDALATLQDAMDKSELPTVIAKLAADVDHDGSITSTDSNTILQAATGKITLDQSYVITNVPDECYYLNPVTF